MRIVTPNKVSELVGCIASGWMVLTRDFIYIVQTITESKPSSRIVPNIARLVIQNRFVSWLVV